MYWEIPAVMNQALGKAYDLVIDSAVEVSKEGRYVVAGEAYDDGGDIFKDLMKLELWLLWRVSPIASSKDTLLLMGLIFSP